MSITIQGHKFDVPEVLVARYAVGYTLQEEGEAHALAQTFLENLRNNFAGKVKSALNGAESLTSDQVTALQSEFTTYAEAYKFGVRQAGTARVRLDPITREMHKLATEDFKKAYFAKFGEKPSKENVDEMVPALVEKRHDDYQKRARAILRQRDSASEGTLEALGL